MSPDASIHGIDGRVPPGAREITTGQANRVWSVDAPTPYILKQYGDPARAANEAAALRLLAEHGVTGPQLLAAEAEATPSWTAQSLVIAQPKPYASASTTPHPSSPSPKSPIPPPKDGSTSTGTSTYSPMPR
ncbi:phosphotransferase [Streptomyces natalensis]|uniref:Aminoglycoside phosphotransferase domain-containing protein n=1 Tax=Streptomyces natalensis ATCC 27448 TaxID=1240678 RepID=A0A0D7CF51_9ACTN|nr:phosphotransferase [Streptomyces natalensis]KIZ14864.1 hypothetical protein SNA_30835 [Streptomyces natalensis ATCC 27448]